MNLAYDSNERLSTMKDATSGTTLQSYSYDNFSNVLTHVANGGTETYTYDAIDGLMSDQQPLGGSTVTVGYSYDIYGRRSRLTYPSYSSQAFYVAYNYNNDNTLANEKVAFNGGTETLQATFTEDAFARLASLKYGPSTPTVTTTPTYDTSSRLSSLKNDLAGGTTNDAIWNLGYSAAQQILTRTQTGSASYKYVAPANVGPNSYGINGLDQITAINATSFTYDTKGNLTSDGTTLYTYNDYNMLAQAVKGATTTNFTYDPSNRLASVAQGGTTTRFIYDGNDVIAEYNGSNVLQRRYVHGPGQDNPLLWYEGTDDTNLRFFTTDQQGNITATTSSAGTLRTIYTYDEYGKPLTATGTDVSRFRHTGQVYLPEVDLYNYKARMYDPKIGRFLQTDPIGYGDGMNWYAYVADDPVNSIDPLGLDHWIPTTDLGNGCTRDTYYYGESNEISGGGRTSGYVDHYYSCYGNGYSGGQGYGDDRNSGYDAAIQMAQYSIIGLRAGLSIIGDAVCGAAYQALGDDGRIRTSADIAAGVGSFGMAGIGLSLRGDLSLEFDAYAGAGVGFGVLGGASLSVDNAGGTQHGSNFTGGKQLSIAGSVPIPEAGGLGGGGSVTIPFKGSTWNAGPPQLNLGVGVGPKYGGYLAGTSNGTYTARSPGLCKSPGDS